MPGVSIAQARARLRLDADVMRVVLEGTGEPAILNGITVKMRKTEGTKRMIPSDAITSFERTSVSLYGIAPETGTHLRKNARLMKESQVEPVPMQPP